MITPVEKKLECVESGDDFPGQPFLFSISLTGLVIELIIRLNNSANIVDNYTLTKNLEIDAQNPNRLWIKKHEIALAPGAYRCKLKMNPNGIRATYMILNWEIL